MSRDSWMGGDIVDADGTTIDLIDDADGTTMTTPEEATRRDGDARWGGDANAFARGA